MRHFINHKIGEIPTGEAVLAITFDEVWNMSKKACVGVRSRVFTPEHSLLACMADVRVRLVLEAAGTSHEALKELLLEYVTQLPRVPKEDLSYTLVMVPSFGHVLALLDEKRNAHGIRVVEAVHFLEAYARAGLTPQDSVHPLIECVIPQVLARYHTKIALAVYNELPGA